jgi:hypothetical protein
MAFAMLALLINSALIAGCIPLQYSLLEGIQTGSINFIGAGPFSRNYATVFPAIPLCALIWSGSSGSLANLGLTVTGLVSTTAGLSFTLSTNPSTALAAFHFLATRRE